MTERTREVRAQPKRHAARRHGLGADLTATPSTTTRDERGSVLILAFVYLIAVSITVLGLSSWITNDLSNVKTFANAREEHQAAQSTVELAMQNIRYTPLIGSNQTWGQFNYCWGSGATTALTIDGFTFDVYCSTVWQPQSSVTRTVTVDACPSTVSQAACTGASPGPYLQAVVVFDDYPPSGAQAVPGSCQLWSWCGEGMTITSWQWA
jgi:hypothetical protein